MQGAKRNASLQHLQAGHEHPPPALVSSQITTTCPAACKSLLQIAPVAAADRPSPPHRPCWSKPFAIGLCDTQSSHAGGGNPLRAAAPGGAAHSGAADGCPLRRGAPHHLGCCGRPGKALRGLWLCVDAGHVRRRPRRRRRSCSTAGLPPCFWTPLQVVKVGVNGEHEPGAARGGMSTPAEQPSAAFPPTLAVVGFDQPRVDLTAASAPRLARLQALAASVSSVAWLQGQHDRVPRTSTHGAAQPGDFEAMPCHDGACRNPWRLPTVACARRICHRPLPVQAASCCAPP